jgi:hypothetical protein
MNSKPVPRTVQAHTRPTLAANPARFESPQTFICWRVNGSRPKRKHASLPSALAERTRLLAIHPGATIIVYELIAVYGRPSIRR